VASPLQRHARARRGHPRLPPPYPPPQAGEGREGVARKTGMAGTSPIGAKLSEGRSPYLSPLAGRGRNLRALRAKFRMRGPLHESELRGKAPSPSTSPPLLRGPLTPTLSPQAGRGSRPQTHRYVRANGDKPGHEGEKWFDMTGTRSSTTASEVVPGRHRKVASPEPITTAPGVWIPGSRAAHAHRNDAHKNL
jgi:hypothetical protein